MAWKFNLASHHFCPTNGEYYIELIWLMYFAERHSYVIDIKRLVITLKKEGKIDTHESKLKVLKNPFVATIRNKMPTVGEWPNPFGDKDIEINMYTSPKELTDTYLIDYLDVFRRVTND